MLYLYALYLRTSEHHLDMLTCLRHNKPKDINMLAQVFPSLTVAVDQSHPSGLFLNDPLTLINL